MNASNMAKTAYASSATPIRTPRGTEYDAFARITRQMKANADQGANFAPLVAALHENNRLWTILAADVSDNSNALPDDLRARIFYLSEFTAQHTRKILRKEASVDVLLDINTAIMRGLRATADAA